MAFAETHNLLQKPAGKLNPKQLNELKGGPPASRALRKAGAQGNWLVEIYIHTSLSQHRTAVSCKENRNLEAHFHNHGQINKQRKAQRQIKQGFTRSGAVGNKVQR